jgi:hypothetical protein
MNKPQLTLSSILFIVTIQILSGQQVQVIKRGETISNYSQEFEILEPQTDSAQFKFVATLSASDTKSEGVIQRLFYAIKGEAKQLGSNVFSIRAFSQEDQTSTLVLDVFYGTNQIFEENMTYHPKNVVFIFGGETDSNQLFSCRVDNKKVVFTSGKYVKYGIPKGGELKVSKGGITGMAGWFGWKEGKPAVMLSLSGFALAGGGVSPTGAGVGFTTGRLNKIDFNLGYLYAQLLKQSN